MNDPSYSGSVAGLRVTETIEGAHPMHPNYPLLPGDLLIDHEDGTYYKFGPGLGIVGFVLTAEQEATLEPYETAYGVGDMAYFLGGDGP